MASPFSILSFTSSFAWPGRNRTGLDSIAPATTTPGPRGRRPLAGNCAPGVPGVWQRPFGSPAAFEVSGRLPRSRLLRPRDRENRRPCQGAVCFQGVPDDHRDEIEFLCRGFDQIGKVVFKDGILEIGDEEDETLGKGSFHQERKRLRNVCRTRGSCIPGPRPSP